MSTNNIEIIERDGNLWLKYKKKNKSGSSTHKAFRCPICDEVKKLSESFTCLAKDGNTGEHTMCFACTKHYVAAILDPNSKIVTHPNGIMCMACDNHITFENLQKKLKNMGPNFEVKLAAKLTE